MSHSNLPAAAAPEPDPLLPHHRQRPGSCGRFLPSAAAPGPARLRHTDEGMEAVAAWCPQLLHLNIGHCKTITDKGLKAVAAGPGPVLVHRHHQPRPDGRGQLMPAAAAPLPVGLQVRQRQGDLLRNISGLR